MLNLAPAAMAQGVSYGGASTAANVGLFANPVGLALAGGQLAFGIANMFQQDQLATQQAYNQAYSNAINQARVEEQNRQIKAAYEAKLDFTKQQIENNVAAADASWVAEQMRLNEVYDTAAYKSQAMQKLLKEALGTAAAREVYGKSARRGALVSTLGAYGRSRAQLVDSLMSETTAAQMRMEQVERQALAQNQLAIAGVAVAPTLATFTPTPMPAAPGFGETAMQVAGLGMQAFQTGYDITPSGGSFLGIPKA